MVNDLFLQATNAHAKNDIKKAEQLYLEILNKDQENFKVLFLIGTLYLQENNIKKSIHYLSQACNVNKLDAHASMNLGLAYNEKNDFINAEKNLLVSLNLDSGNPNIHNNLGNFYLKKKNYDEALNCFLKAVDLDSNNCSYLLNLSECYFQLSLVQDSIETLSKIPSNNEFFFTAQGKLFNIFYKIKNYKKCISLGRKLLNESSNFNKKDIILKVIHSQLSLGEFLEVEQSLKLLEQNSDDHQFYLALFFLEKGDYQNSKIIFEKLLKKHYEEDICHLNLGVMNFRLCEFELAIDHFKLSLQKNPNNLEAKIQLGLCQLSQCNFVEGWSNFFFYQERNIFNNRIDNKIPKWNGSDLNKKILIIFDQGIGDQIFFSSLLNRLNKANKYDCLVNKKLIDIFKNSFTTNFSFLTETDNIKQNEYDCYLKATELGNLFIAKKSDLKKQQKYLTANNPALFNEKPIGLSWYSSNELIGKKKSIDLDALILNLKEKTKFFISLQYGDFNEAINKVCKKHGVHFINTHDNDHFNDISGLANLIMGCREVYSISNTTAHLAGALGVHVNLMLPFNHSSNTWYWFSDNHKSLWYPSIKTFEADKLQDLSTALDKIKKAPHERGF